MLKLFDADADSGIFFTLDPGSGMGKIRIRDKQPGSATLLRDQEPMYKNVGCTKKCNRRVNIVVSV